jgi:GDP-L-fucose synthase
MPIETEMRYMNLSNPIFIAGHRGLVGSAIHRELTRLGYTNLITLTRAELDLLDSVKVNAFFARNRPKHVVLAAAKVGGILANNTYPADFIRDNLVIQTNIIEASRINQVDRLLFLGSSCIYPKLAPQPMPESCLLTGPLEPTNRSYALAKDRWYRDVLELQPAMSPGPYRFVGIAARYFVPYVLPALIRKTAEAIRNGATELVVWGTGTPRRELLHSDDLAQACVFLMNLDEERYNSLLVEDIPPLINIGTGEDITIRELAETVARVLGFKGKLVFDSTKPDGTPRKLMDVTILHQLGWHHSVGLEQGIRLTWDAVNDLLWPQVGNTETRDQTN